MIRKLLSRRVSSSNGQPQARTRSSFEPLEKRVLMHNTFITGASGDIRGEVFVNFEPGAIEIPADQFNRNSVQMYLAGPDGHVGNADDVRVHASIRYKPSNQRLLIRSSEIPAGHGYRIKIVSSRIDYAPGFRMDGEFDGTFPTGNGVAGGNFEFQVKNDKSLTPRVRMSSSEGVMTLRMRADVAPATVHNFITYANAGDYDNSFFTRNIPGFIIQGGSLQVNDSNTVVEGVLRDPVQNEFNISNTRGTLAMAKQGGDPNSATNQFFFNLGDNSANLDTQNGGFTVFAQVYNPSSLTVMDRIADNNVVALHNPVTGNGQLPNFPATGLTNVPILGSPSDFQGQNEVVNPQTNEQQFVVTSGLDPLADLVIVRRVATLMRIAPL